MSDNHRLHHDIRSMPRDELGLMLEWARAEGWNPGLHDAEAFHATDPDGFLLAQVGGQPVSCISAVRYGNHFGFVGFYIVPPELRGQGHGAAVWHAALARLEGRLIGLDGVPEQQDKYRRSGFTLAHRNIRYEGTGFPSHTAAVDPQLIDLLQLPLATVVDYDRAFFPVPRAVFLEPWLKTPSTVALARLQGQALRGYGVMRACQQGWKIGPLFADTPQDAEALFIGLARRSAGQPFYLDVPESNPAALALAARHRLREVFETARMYTGPAPELSLDRTYGITTFELG